MRLSKLRQREVYGLPKLRNGRDVMRAQGVSVENMTDIPIIVTYTLLFITHVTDAFIVGI